MDMEFWSMEILTDECFFCLNNFLDKEDTIDSITTTLIQDESMEYIEIDEGIEIIAASILVIGMLNPSTLESIELGPCEDRVKNYVQESPNRYKIDQRLKEICYIGLNRILDKNSELNELWSENVQLYPDWKKFIKFLINMLKK